MFVNTDSLKLKLNCGNGNCSVLLYENIDQILPNKLHGPMYYKIGVTCVYLVHGFYTLLL